MLRQMQRRPRVRCAADESMARNVIARIEAIEVHAHASKLFAAILGQRAYPFVDFATLALFDECVRELLAGRKFCRIRSHESNERRRIRPSVSIDQTTPQRFRDTERQPARHESLR